MASQLIRWAAFLAAFFTLGGISLFTAAVSADEDCGDIAEGISHGGIIWTENAIIVQGTAAPNLSDPYKQISAIKRETQRAATLDAYRKVSEILAGVSITGDRLASDSPQVLARVQAYVPQPIICKSKFYADGGIDIVVKVPLGGNLAKALLPEAGTRVAASKSKFSGLIVDARELAFTPAFAPRLLSPDGKTLFSQENVKTEVITKRAAVQYVNHTEDINKGFIGKKPLKVRAIGLGPLSPSDLVLDQKAAQALVDMPAFLGDGKVVIITSPVRKLECKHLAAKIVDHKIDWEQKIALARGFGKVDFSGKEDNAVRLRMMERAAEVDAQRKLLGVLLDLKISGMKSLKQAPKASKYIQGVLNNAVRCGAKYYKDGTSEVVLAARIDGLAVKAAELGQQSLSSMSLSKLNPSGLIVDATDLQFTPVLAPQVAGSDGGLIYGPHTIARGYAQRYGVVGYRRSMKVAKSDKRIGQNPIIVRAARFEKRSSRLVLSTQDTDKLMEVGNLTGLFQQGRVLIVTNNTIQN